MKKIFITFLCAFIASCDTASNDSAVLSSGKIVKIIENDTEKPIIYVRFPGTDKYSYTFKFIGSDSCKIGQSIKLQ